MCPRTYRLIGRDVPYGKSVGMASSHLRRYMYGIPSHVVTLEALCAQPSKVYHFRQMALIPRVVLVARL